MAEQLHLPTERWRALAEEAVLALIDHEHAVIWPEVEAKLAEAPVRTASGLVLPKGIQPHHLSTARRRLTASRRVEEITSRTRGGGDVSVLALRDRRRRGTAFEIAARRKRLLHARYLGWTRESAKGPNLIGAGGERLARASLEAAVAAGVGYRPAERGAQGQVTRLFGAPVAGGPLDDAAYLTTLDPQDLPLTVTLPIEVKNVRHWIYPNSWEPFQLLDKAARLQLTHPELRILPVFICRRAHITTFAMARDSGIRVLSTLWQPILPHSKASTRAVDQVNRELGFDLRRTSEPHNYLVNAFQKTIPEAAAPAAARWAQVAPIVAPFATRLRNPGLSPPERARLLAEMHDALSTALPDVQTVWRPGYAVEEPDWEPEPDWL
jgi:hypothetical protein